MSSTLRLREQEHLIDRKLSKKWRRTGQMVRGLGSSPPMTPASQTSPKFSKRIGKSWLRMMVDCWNLFQNHQCYVSRGPQTSRISSVGPNYHLRGTSTPGLKKLVLGVATNHLVASVPIVACLMVKWGSQSPLLILGKSYQSKVFWIAKLSICCINWNAKNINFHT